jgi:predicted small secreted protein
MKKTYSIILIILLFCSLFSWPQPILEA